MILLVFYSIILCVAIGFIYLIMARDLFIKIISFTYISNIVIALIALLSLVKGNESYLDIALIYAAIGPISIIIIVKYLKVRK